MMDMKQYKMIKKNLEGSVQDLTGSDLNNTDEKGNTLLHYAAQLNDVITVKRLLKDGAIYNSENNDGKKPLDITHSSEIKDLLHTCDNFFKSVKKGNTYEVSKYISDEKILLNVKEVGSFNSLHRAAEECHDSVVKLLLKNGINIIQSTDKGFTPLHIAVFKKSESIAELLLQSIDSNALLQLVNAKTHEKLSTCLHIAAENGCFDILKLLLKNGAIYNIKNIMNNTPFHLCMEEKTKRFLKLIDDFFGYANNSNSRLLYELTQMETSEFQAAINARNHNQHTLLQELTIQNDKLMAAKLLSLLQSRNKNSTKWQWTLKELKDLEYSILHLDTSFQTDIIFLSDAIKSDYSNPSNHLRTGLNYLENARKLLSICEEHKSCFNVDENIHEIKTTLKRLEFDSEDAATFHSNHEISVLNKKYFYKLLFTTSEQKITQFINIVKWSIGKSAENVLQIVKKQRFSFQPYFELMKFIEENNCLEVLKCLKKGANINALNTGGESPLQRAIKYGHTDIVNVLLQNGADINMVTPQGNTFIHLAAMLNVSFLPDREAPFNITITILKHGAIYNALNHEGETPLNVSKHRNICKLLKNIDICFKNAEEANTDVLSVLGSMNENELCAVTQARNDKGCTFLQTVSLARDKNIENKILCMLKKSKK